MSSYTQQAIEKASQGGYDKNVSLTWMQKNRYQLILDPDFWRALGKSEGWAEMCDPYCKGAECSECEKVGYLKKWHRLIDHLAEGGDIESYFKELLNHE